MKKAAIISFVFVCFFSVCDAQVKTTASSPGTYDNVNKEKGRTLHKLSSNSNGKALIEADKPKADPSFGIPGAKTTNLLDLDIHKIKVSESPYTIDGINKYDIKKVTFPKPVKNGN